MRVWREKWGPLTLALVLTVIAARVPALAKAFANPSEALLSAGINLAAIFIGFVGTMASILMTMNGPGVQFMKKVGKFTVLIDYLWGAIRTSFVYLAISIALLMVTGDPVPAWKRYMAYAWLFAGAWAILSTYRALSISVILIKNSMDE